MEKSILSIWNFQSSQNGDISNLKFVIGLFFQQQAHPILVIQPISMPILWG